MQSIQITLRDIPMSAALESHIRQKAEKLERYYDRIMNCRVVIDVPQKHKHQGKLYNVKIDLTVPGKEIVVTRKLAEDVYVAIRDSFNALTRKLEAYARKRSGHIKTHKPLMHGRVARIIPEEGFGFIDGMDGNEYYFSLTHVAYPHFDQLAIGDGVEYLAVPFNDGRQAHHITRE